jgi:hypothetical protein
MSTQVTIYSQNVKVRAALLDGVPHQKILLPQELGLIEIGLVIVEWADHWRNLGRGVHLGRLVVVRVVVVLVLVVWPKGMLRGRR